MTKSSMSAQSVVRERIVTEIRQEFNDMRHDAAQRWHDLAKHTSDPSHKAFCKAQASAWEAAITR